jgi:hypothetical protein
MNQEDILNILLDTLTVAQKNERESKSQVTLEEMLKLVWTYEQQNLVQRHLGLGEKHSTITKFIQKVTGWEVTQQLNKGAHLKKKLMAIANALEIKGRIAETYHPSPVCTEEVIKRIYAQQNSMLMVSLDILKEHNLISESVLPMVEAMACQAKEVK